MGERWRDTPWWRLAGSIFALSFIVVAAWGVAMPLLSGPDEPTHVVKAAGVARGQFVGACIDVQNNPRAVCSKDSPFTEMRLPAFFSILRPSGNIPGSSIPGHGVACYAHHPTIPASCTIFAGSSIYAGRTADAWIYDGRYPPLYYVVVGLPTRLGEGLWDLYLMRFASAAASAAMITVALFWILRRAGRMMVLGVILALTPMALYLGGIINSSGLETTSALAFWVTFILLTRVPDPPRALVVSCAVVAAIFVSTRSLSLFWCAVAAVLVLMTARWETIVALTRRTDLRVAVGLFSLVAVADAVWVIYEHSTVLDVASANAKALVPSASTSEWSILATSFHHNIYYIPGMVGVFGSFDTYSPTLTLAIWYGLSVLLLLAGIAATDLRRRVVLIAVAVFVVLLPVAISSSQARHIGYVWSGRDTLPFAVGMPVLAAALLSERPLADRLARVTPVVLALAYIAQLAAFFVALRRYAVGTAGPHLSFLVHSPWSPPVIGCIGALALYGVALLAAYGAALASCSGRRPAPRAIEDAAEPVGVA